MQSQVTNANKILQEAAIKEPEWLRITGAQQLQNVWKNREHVVLDLFSNLKWVTPMVTFGERLEHVLTLRGLFCRVCGVAL